MRPNLVSTAHPRSAAVLVAFGSCAPRAGSLLSSRFFVALLALLVTLGVLPSLALAHWGEEKIQFEGRKRADKPREGPRGRAEISLPSGGPILRLAPVQGAMAATFTLRNAGDGPLEVFRVGFEGEPGAPRVPAGLGVSSSDRDSKVLGPGESRTYTVRWRWEETRANQLHGFLVVESDGAAAGATEFDPPVSLPVEADRRPAPLRYILTLVVFLSLIVSVAGVVAPSRLQDRQRRAIAAALALVCALVALVPLATFSRLFGRQDGGWGLQHVERFRLFGDVEYFVGLDGLNAALLPLGPLVLLAAISAARSPKLDLKRFLVLGGVLTALSTLFVVSQSLAISAAALCAIAGVASMLVLSAAPRPQAVKTIAAFAIAAVAFLAFAWLTSKHMVPTRLADGSRVTTTFALPEIAREAAHGHGVAASAPKLFGLSFLRGDLLLALVAFAALAGVAPLHGWVADLCRHAEPGVSALLLGLTSLASGYGIVRYGAALFPDVVTWLATPVLVLAIPTVIVAGLRAILEDDWRRLVGHLAVASAGSMFLAVATATPQGLEGAVVGSVSRTLALPLSLLVVGMLVDRTGEGRVLRAGGIAAAAPRLTAVLLVAFATLAALPGTTGFIAMFSTVVGEVGRAPFLAGGVAVGLVLTSVAAARALTVLGTPRPAWWRSNTRLEPHGGAFPDLRRDEMPGTILIALLLVALAIAPGAWWSLSDTTILDVFRALSPAGPTQVS